MAATLAAARDDVLAEQRSMAELAGRATRARDYLGAAGTASSTPCSTRAPRPAEESPMIPASPPSG